MKNYSLYIHEERKFLENIFLLFTLVLENVNLTWARVDVNTWQSIEGDRREQREMRRGNEIRKKQEQSKVN